MFIFSFAVINLDIMPDEEMNEQWDTQETAPEQQGGPPAEPEAAPSQEEEIVGSRRREVRPARKMSAADFKVKSEPKPEPTPEVQDVVGSRQPESAEQAPPAQQPTPEARSSQSADSGAQEARSNAEPPQSSVQPPVQERPVQEARPQAPPQPSVQPPVQERPVQEARPASSQSSVQPPVQKKPVQEARPAPPQPSVQPQVQERPVQPSPPAVEEPYEEEPIISSSPEMYPEEDFSQSSAEEEYEFTPAPAREPRRGLKRAAKPVYQKQEDVTPTKEGVIGALKGALSFFTLFRLNVGENEMESLSKNFYISPVAGFVIGMIAALLGILLFELNLDIAIAAVIVATVFILSKFLHFDGLADFGDGMIVSGSREDHIRALKDTRIGAGGVGVALVVTLVTFAGLAGLSNVLLIVFMLSMVVITAEVFAKNAMVAAAAFGKPGEGMAAKQVHNTDMITMFMSTAISAALALLGYLVMGAIVSVLEFSVFYSEAYVMIVLTVAASAVISILAGWMISNMANRTFGYVNGDVLGATNEIARALVILVAAIVIGSCVLWL